MINDRGFYVPPTRGARRIERHKTFLHLLGGALLGVLMAVCVAAVQHP